MIVLLDGLKTVVNYLIALMDGKFTASVADFNETDPSSLSYIKNKPTSDDALALAIEMELVSPVVSEAGTLFTDENGKLYLI